MLEDRVKILSENLARSMDRRKFLRRAGGTIFAGLAALASGHLLGAGASAGVPDPRRKGALLPSAPMIPNCKPPGPYCNLEDVQCYACGYDPNACHGSACFQHIKQGQLLECRIDYRFYGAGCWTAGADGGYWTCCDCECRPPGNPTANPTFCGCSSFSANPSPRPD